MALEVTLAQQDGSQDCTNLYVKDTTTGASGYGAPNYTIAAVDHIAVEVIIPTATEYSPVYSINNANAQGIMAGTTNLDINSTVIDQDQTEESALQDGVYVLRYTPFWTAVATITVTNASTSATASTTLAVAPYAGVNRMLIDGEYYGVTIVGTAVTLDRAYIGSSASGVAFKAGFSTSIYLKQMCNGNNCVSAQIAAVFNQSCNCSELEKNAVFAQYQNLIAAGYMWTFEEYVQFQLLMNLVTNYCNSLDGGCGCGG